MVPCILPSKEDAWKNDVWCLRTVKVICLGDSCVNGENIACVCVYLCVISVLEGMCE